ncbi:Similar to PIG-B: GPI mannosyltransferase 3 (Drosophila melanogaster) [Cotesia congregata]|uniref:Mannosyltransferase n=1 Tax=Cotesia congregata TaxID=51543 RepID=A0A8J2HNQ0_COTCN|nr:Similar to PIG-B: GPI mannosyltransferase 3 (Drosophila melanogaster) [Cotesia congregata]
MFLHYLRFGRMADRNLLYFLIFIKLIVCWLVKTFYVPDEYWQSLEVAHRQAFGYGYLTWEWNYKIRSYVYPFVISIIYKILAIFRLDSPEMIIFLPRLFQAMLSGFAEYRFSKWTQNDLTTVFLLMNPFWNYCATRTLINTLETSLTMIALSIFPWNEKDKHRSNFIWLVGFMFFIRPTAAIMWAPLCLYHVYIFKKSINQLIKDYFFIGLCVSGIAIAIDSYCYGQLVVTPWEFFKVNVLTNVANHYGKQPLLWYLYSALPVFLLIKPLISLAIIVWTITIYSVLPHKEHRFILPLLPLLVYLITNYNYQTHVSEKLKNIIVFILLFINFGLLCYIGIVHQQGSTKIMHYLRYEIDNSQSDVDVMFLTPCHSTPFYSYVHQNISIEFLTCEPNLQNQDNYLDEADIFFNDPMAWLEKRYTNSTLPLLVVIYDNLAPRIKGFIDNYRLVLSDYTFREKRDKRNVVNAVLLSNIFAVISSTL